MASEVKLLRLSLPTKKDCKKCRDSDILPQVGTPLGRLQPAVTNALFGKKWIPRGKHSSLFVSCNSGAEK
jgi:hypothetical protein